MTNCLKYPIYLLLGGVLSAASLQADTGCEQLQHIEVGSRLIPDAELRGLEEERGLLLQQAMGDESADDEEGSRCVLQSIECLSDDSGDSKAEVKEKDLIAKHPAYYTSHEGAVHRPILISPLGTTVELEDGSIWTVSPGCRGTVLNWLASDRVVILPNHAWFSSYSFQLINQTIGSSVEVNLYLGPIYNGLFTHWIVAMDYENRKICLEDGSIWKISFWDGGILSRWLVNDTVIIGINDGWSSGGNPNMLINVNLNNSVVGKCVY